MDPQFVVTAIMLGSLRSFGRRRKVGAKLGALAHSLAPGSPQLQLVGGSK